jgi:hypothetical protein
MDVGHSTPKRWNTCLRLSPAASASRVRSSAVTFSSARATTCGATAFGIATQPSTSPKTRSPGSTRTPATSTAMSIAAISARPFESSGPMPPAKTGNRISRMRRTSRTSPSVRQPAAPRMLAAVVRSSPQGAIRSVGPSQASTATSPGARLSMRSISISYGFRPGST